MAESLYLIAHIAGRGIAIHADEVDSVVDIDGIVPVPRSGRGIRGVAALRSRVVTVVDTWTMLGLDAATGPVGRAVITCIDGHDYAILVDTVEDVASFALAPLSSGIALEAGWRRAARGIVERDGEPMLAVSLAALIPLAA